MRSTLELDDELKASIVEYHLKAAYEWQLSRRGEKDSDWLRLEFKERAAYWLGELMWRLES